MRLIILLLCIINVSCTYHTYQRHDFKFETLQLFDGELSIELDGLTDHKTFIVGNPYFMQIQFLFPPDYKLKSFSLENIRLQGIETQEIINLSNIKRTKVWRSNDNTWFSAKIPSINLNYESYILEAQLTLCVGSITRCYKKDVRLNIRYIEWKEKHYNPLL